MLVRLDRFGIDERKYWDVATSFEGENKHELFIRTLRDFARNPAVVTMVAAILHICDETEWGLVPELTAKKTALAMMKTLPGIVGTPGVPDWDYILDEKQSILENWVRPECLVREEQLREQTMTGENPVFPFSAIVGQDGMKDALLANVVFPSIGGVLIRGEKGTAKSTTVRALADLLPEREVVKGCIFRCSPSDTRNLCESCRKKIAENPSPETEPARMQVIELPLCATEDRMAGTLDIEHALTKGTKKFEPGVLASANGNILYVDEVNLLDDHIVDLLLDAAAMGVNFVEREGISYSHPARFLLVGTMNPEEGDLRPQLLDRFGLVVDVEGEKDRALRSEIVKRRLAFESDPSAFMQQYAPQQQAVRERVLAARDLIKKMTPDDRLIGAAVKISLALGVDGHRADLTLVKASLAFAALDGQNTVTREHIERAAEFSLPHRMRRQPFEESRLDTGTIRTLITESYESP